jgi:antitoxin VapB
MLDLSQETEALARRLADAQRTSVDDAVRRALEAGAHAAGLNQPKSGGSRDSSPEAVAARRARINPIVREITAMPVLDRRSPSEIMDDLNEL